MREFQTYIADNPTITNNTSTAITGVEKTNAKTARDFFFPFWNNPAIPNAKATRAKAKAKTATTPSLNAAGVSATTLSRFDAQMMIAPINEATAAMLVAKDAIPSRECFGPVDHDASWSDIGQSNSYRLRRSV